MVACYLAQQEGGCPKMQGVVSTVEQECWSGVEAVTDTHGMCGFGVTTSCACNRMFEARRAAPLR